MGKLLNRHLSRRLFEISCNITNEIPRVLFSVLRVKVVYLIERWEWLLGVFFFGFNAQRMRNRKRMWCFLVVHLYNQFTKRCNYMRDQSYGVSDMYAFVVGVLKHASCFHARPNSLAYWEWYVFSLQSRALLVNIPLTHTTSQSGNMSVQNKMASEFWQNLSYMLHMTAVRWHSWAWHRKDGSLSNNQYSNW